MRQPDRVAVSTSSVKPITSSRCSSQPRWIWVLVARSMPTINTVTQLGQGRVCRRPTTKFRRSCDLTEPSQSEDAGSRVRYACGWWAAEQ